VPGGALAEEKLILVLTDLMVLDPTWNLAVEENQKYVLKTRDIPTLNPSLPPPSNGGFNPPSPPLAHSSGASGRSTAIISHWRRSPICKSGSHSIHGHGRQSLRHEAANKR